MLYARVALRRLALLPALALCGVLLAASARAAPPAALRAATQETMTFYAVADAYVKSSTPDTNYGGATTLNLSYSGVDKPVEEAAVVRFDLGGLPAGALIDTAALELYLTGASGTSPKSIVIYLLTSSWAEGSVTYNSFPTIQPDFPLGAAVDSLSGQYKTWWVTSWAKYWQANPGKNFGVMLRRSTAETDTFSRVFESKEANAHRPRLAVTYHLCYPLTRTHSGSGGDPVAMPANSAGCAAGQYVAGETIGLGASPSPGWQVSGWSGTNNNASTSTTNATTMPAAAHTVSVAYSVIPPTCYPLTRTHSGSGGDPVAMPANSAGCAAGQYVAGETIGLGASPSPGWQVSGWSGTNNNASTSATNATTMPAAAHTVSVAYKSSLKTITFEENIPLPSAVNSQYCNGAVPNMGVQFLSLPRIGVPLSYLALGGPVIALPSPVHALYSTITPAWDKQIVAVFTTGQSYVTVMVGLDRAYSAAVTAKMEAYSSATPSPSTLVDTDAVWLGKGPADITQPLAVSAGSPTIRSVVIDFTASVAVAEMIDNLSFTHIGPPCANDTSAPTVQITQPDSEGKVLQTVYNTLGFTAQDQETGVAKVYVAFLDGSGKEVEGFSACTGYMPCAAPDGKTQQGSFVTAFPTTAAKIRVTAWDFANHTGQAERNISFLLPKPNFNLWVRGVEITQGTQLWVPYQETSRAASAPVYPYPAAPTAVPLAAGRVTFVRIYAGLEGSGAVPLIGARARVRLDAGDPNSPTTWWQTATVQPTDTPDDSFYQQRLLAVRSWNIMLPNAWTTAADGTTGSQRTLNLEVEIEAPPGLSECAGCVDGANRLRIPGVTFTQVDPFWQRVNLLGYEFQAEGVTYPLIAGQVKESLDYIRRTYPVVESSVPVSVAVTGVYSDGRPLEIKDKATLDKRCSEFLGFVHLAGGWYIGPYSKPPLGLISHAFSCAGIGEDSDGGYAYARVSGLTGAGHELGHAYGLNHCGPPPGHVAECSVASWCDDDWPWPHGTIGGWGFNTLTLQPYPPGAAESDYHDFMSYGKPNLWISPRNWIKLFNVFAHASLPYPKATAAVVDEAAAVDYLLVRGRQVATGWELQPAYTLSLAAGTDDGAGEGEYRIELAGAGGSVLFTRRFSLETGHVDDRESGAATAGLPAFSELMPKPNGLRRIVLLRGETVLASWEASSHAPTVTLTSPTAGGFAGMPDHPVIKWDGQDADGDALAYWVQYTPGGGAGWLTLGLNLSGEELPVSLAGLPGGAAARVRVLVSDGVLGSRATSPAFVVGNHAPLPAILSPADGATVQEGEPMMLLGAASDVEDGVLGGEALAWRVGDQTLGTGARLDGVALKPGTRTITLAATDSGGQSATTTITLHVQARTNSRPEANAGPDQWVAVDTLVALDGRGSHDADGDALVYEWTAAGAGHLPEPGAAVAPFWASLPGDYAVTLTVYDGQVRSAADTVTVHVTGEPPSRVYAPVLRR